MKTRIAVIRGPRWPSIGIVVLGLLACSVMAPTAQAAGLLIADGGLGGLLEIEEHTVQVTINNGVAVTEVTQVFRNTESRQVEALYTFPVPKDASVAGFSMWIGGKEMVGEVVEKVKARQIYESYKPKRRDPGLLEQTDYKTFEMRIFPINAGAQQKVQIRYYQELDVDDDCATYVYPLAGKTRSGLNATTKGKFAMNLRAKSEVPIAAMGSPSHPKDFLVAKRSEFYYQASLETKGGDLNRDVVLTYRLSRPQTGIDLLASRRAGDEGYFCLTVTAGSELAQANPPMDYLFILDISGSMADDGKLQLSRRSVEAFINALGAEDRFEVLTFNVALGVLFSDLHQANEESKSKAVDFLAAQTAKGGTILRPALEAAYKYAGRDRPLNVVILSDGMTEQGEKAALVEMIRSRPPVATVFCIGVGNEVNRPLLEQLAEDAGGLAAFISESDDFQRQAKSFRRKLLHPAATNLRIDLEGAKAYDLEPPNLPNLYHGMPVRLYGRYREPGAAKITVRAMVNGRDISKTLDVKLPEVEESNPEIERMWAMKKVERLLREADRGADREQAKSEIVRLGEAYSIATQHTSFIVLENDAEFQRWTIERRNSLRVARDRQAQERLASQLEALTAKVNANLGPERSAPQLEEPTPMAQQASASGPRAPATPGPSRGWNLDLPKPGGGPVGPIVGLIVAALAVAEWQRRRRERQ